MAVLEVAFPVFAVVAVGWGLARFRTVDLAGVTEILLYAALPALVVDSSAKHQPDPVHFGRVAVAAILVMGGVLLAAVLVTRALGLPRRGIMLTAAFMNAGNFGLPFALLAWGDEGLSHAVIYYLTMAIIHNSLGIWIAAGGRSGWVEMFRVPLLYAAVVGLTLSWTGHRLPESVETAVGLVAQTAIPLMLISLGCTLRNLELATLKPAIIATIMRMGGGFGLGLLVTTLGGYQGTMRNVIILSSSMPAAVLNIVLAHRYRADPQVVATTVLVSTLVSIFTIPLLLGWLA